MSPKTAILWGPAGTGKTTAGTLLAEEWFKDGCLPHEVGYFGFTRAAAQEAVRKILDVEGVTEDTIRERFPLFRTLHSLAFMGLKRAKPDVRVATTADMKRFGKLNGFEGAFAVQGWEDLAEILQKMSASAGGEASVWDQCLEAYNLSRISSSTADELTRAAVEMSPLACRLGFYIDTDVYRMFVSRYESWKVADGLVDFVDMLTFALTEMDPLDLVKHVVVDEAQDLSPILYAIVDRLFPAAEDVWWIGDDFQAIFSFCGASAKLFLDRAKQSHHQIALRQTHRFGQGIVDFSDRIIKRVREKMPKEILGVPGREGGAHITGEFKPSTGDVLILHRHIAGCQAIAQAYIDAGLPFRNERGRDPLSAPNRLKAWMAIDGLSSGRKVGFGTAKILIEDLMPSVFEGTRFVVHGAKKKLEEMTRAGVALPELIEMGILTPAGADIIKQRKYPVLKHTEDLEYYERLTKAGHDVDREGKATPTITTIHGSKGRQAGRVVVFSEMSARCMEDEDTEHRLAYVAATRTKSDVEICAERSVDWAKLQYDYPV